MVRYALHHPCVPALTRNGKNACVSLLSRIPPGLRKAIVRVLPDSWADAIRRARMRRHHLPSVTVRESRAVRFLKQRVLRLYYPESMVNRQSAPRRWFTTRVLRRKPLLHHFEIHITDHCNLNCKGCGHFSNLCRPSLVTRERYDSDLVSMARLFEVEQIFLLGGEPLLHPDVAEFVRIARTRFPASRLYLLTNGTLVTRMSEEFWEALAETETILLCDLYPVDLPVDTINELGAAHGVTVEWTDPRGEFFKIPIDLTKSQDPADSFRRCTGVNNCPMVRDGRLYPCAFAAYSHILAERFELPGIVASDEDSVPIDGSMSAEEIMSFLLKPVPWCGHCDFDSFTMFEWGRSARTLDEWVDTPCR